MTEENKAGTMTELDQLRADNRVLISQRLATLRENDALRRERDEERADRIEALVEAQAKEIAELRAENAQLREELADTESAWEAHVKVISKANS